MGGVILILSDGLRFDAARDGMGFLGHLVESGAASLQRVRGELPSMSRPMYETIHTGVPASVHGIVANSVVRKSNMPNVFGCAAQAGLVTAAVAYWWFSELYNRAPYDPVADREVDDPSLPIAHGRFYTEDEHPDVDLFASAANLVRRHAPAYLLLHPMSMDHTGETFGADSSEYRNQAIRQDMQLAPYIREWMGCGYSILVTGDHGINRDGAHGGTTPDQRDVPLYIIPASGKAALVEEDASQLQLAPTILNLLGLPLPASMKQPPLFQVTGPDAEHHH